MWVAFEPVLRNHNQTLLNASCAPRTLLDVCTKGAFDRMKARLITSLLKIHNYKFVKISFKFILVAKIADVSIITNFGAKGTQSIDLKLE